MAIWWSSPCRAITAKPRPAVIVQEPAEGPAESVIVCPLTSTLIVPGPVRPVLEPDQQNGLRLTSQVMVDKITSIAVRRLGHRMGSLTMNDMQVIDQALAKLLGLSSRAVEPIDP